MQKKLRRKFVLIAIASLFVILTLLVAGINIANYHMVTKSLDNMLHMLAYSDGELPQDFPKMPFGSSPPPEIRFTTRFFIVHCDEDGEVIGTFMEHISSVTEEDAGEYAREVLSKQRPSGYYRDYRYCAYQESGKTVLIFLNVGSELQTMKTLFLLSVAVASGALLAMFLLVLLLSGYAISPFVKNMENQTRFITDAGHELKTPLTSISASADILALDDCDNEWVRNIQDQSARLSRLVGDLVTLSRLDEETPIPEKAEFSLSEALWESSEPFASLAKAQGKKYDQTIEDGLSFHGDVIAIQQMVSVLLDNALRYSDDGGYIRLDAYRKRQKLVIEVFNTCNKLDTKNLNRLFDRFYRGDPSRSGKISGTGVGLSIAKAIAAAHGGDISVKSQSGNSIRFQITL